MKLSRLAINKRTSETGVTPRRDALPVLDMHLLVCSCFNVRLSINTEFASKS